MGDQPPKLLRARYRGYRNGQASQRAAIGAVARPELFLAWRAGSNFIFHKIVVDYSQSLRFFRHLFLSSVLPIPQLVHSASCEGGDVSAAFMEFYPFSIKLFRTRSADSAAFFTGRNRRLATDPDATGSSCASMCAPLCGSSRER